MLNMEINSHAQLQLRELLQLYLLSFLIMAAQPNTAQFKPRPIFQPSKQSIGGIHFPNFRYWKKPSDAVAVPTNGLGDNGGFEEFFVNRPVESIL